MEHEVYETWKFRTDSLQNLHGCMGFGDPNNGQHTWTVDEAHTREIVKGGLEPVSYTHLDVYKRQEGGRRNIKLL